MTLPKIPLRCIIRTDGTITEIPKSTNAQLHELCGCDLFDTVNLRNRLGQVMLVDDAGYEAEMVKIEPGYFVMQPKRALKPVNAIATELYLTVCVPGTTHQIVGDVAVVPDEDFA